MRIPRLWLAFLLVPLQIAIVAPALPRGQTADAQVPPPDTEVELPELRTANSLTFLQPDGTYNARIYAGAINYQDATGAWQAIDNTLVSSSEPGYAYENQANSFRVLLPSDLGAAPVKVSTSLGDVSFGLVGAGGTPSLIAPTRANYPSALPGVAVSYQAGNEMVKETLTLSDPGAPGVFTFKGQASAGLTAREISDGIEFFAGDFYAGAESIFSFTPPFAVDAGGVVSDAEDVSMALTWPDPTFTPQQQPTDFIITLAVNPAWLADPARQWPVVVDPTMRMGLARDCHISSATLTSTLCARPDLQAGMSDGNKQRILLNFDLSPLPPLPVVLKADLGLWVSGNTGTATSYRIHRVTRAWTNSASWTKHDGTNSWSTAGGDFDASWVDERSGFPVNAYRRWFPTSLVRDWVNGKYPNLGMLLKQNTETTSNVLTFVSSENSPDNSSQWPFLDVNYARQIGEYSPYTFWDFDLTDRMHAHANVVNGNLVVHASDFSVPGTGPSLVVDRYYNNLETRSTGDSGWRFSLPQDVKLTIFSDGSVSYQGPSGYRFPFLKLPISGAFVSPPGIDATLTKNADGTYSLKFHQSEETFNFDSTGRWTSEVDRNNNRISFAYPSSTLMRITDTQGRITEVTTTSGGLITSIRDSGGRTYSYTYDANSNLTSYQDPTAGVTRYGYDSLRRIIEITSVGGSRTKFTYPASNERRLSSVVQVLSGETGPTTIFDEQFNSSRTIVTDPKGNRTTYEYDTQGRVTKVTDARGNSSSATYNTDGDVLTDTDATGQVVHRVYNSLNALTQVTLPTGAAEAWTYGNSGHPYSPTRSTDTQGERLDYSYDARGNVTSVTNPDNSDTFRWTFNTNGTTNTTTDARGSVTTYGYDSAGNLTSIDYPDPLATVAFTYDTTISRVSTMTDGKGQTSSFTYDLLDRLTRITFGDGSQVSYAYDGNGNIVSETDAAGTTTFTYDALNRMTRKTLPGGSSITYAFDEIGNVTSLTDSGGTVNYGYDGVYNLTSLTEPGGHQTTFTYDKNDRRVATVYPNGVKLGIAWDSSSRLCKIASTRGTLPSPFTCTSSAPSPLTSFSYTYAEGSADTSLRQTMTDNVAGDTTTYTYDDWNRLTRADRSATGVVDFQYSYDSNGNRTSQSVSGATTNYSYNAANQLTSAGSTTFSYDANGNLTASSAGLSLSYNAKNQTTSITPPGGPTVPFSYRKVDQTERTSKASVTFLNHTFGLGSENAGGQTTYYRWNGDLAEPFALTSEQIGTNRYYYLFDGLGSVVGLTDASGNLVNTYAYEPYGKIRSQTGTVANPWLFTGAYFDRETGFYKMGARYYDPSLAIWTQIDPLQYGKGSCTGGYAYVGGDPINHADPTGLARRRSRGWRCFLRCVLVGTFGPSYPPYVGAVCGGLIKGCLRSGFACAGAAGCVLGLGVITIWTILGCVGECWGYDGPRRPEPKPQPPPPPSPAPNRAAFLRTGYRR